MREDTKNLYGFLSDYHIHILENYLINRFKKNNSIENFNVVFDLLHQCDLNCIGCGTDAHFLKDIYIQDEYKLSYDAIDYILLKIKEYAENIKRKVFINFGGGEPFLRKDIIRILNRASELFGTEGVGIDTNASLLDSYDLICQATNYVSYIGISVNGLHDYHNWWANNHTFDAFERTTNVVKKLCKNNDIASKLEITTVATTKNIQTIPFLMELLSNMGVENYSVHRAIPVGRMAKLKIDLIPSWKQYLLLLIEMIEISEKIGMNAHLHHSIEGIHATLMCGIDTMAKHKFIDKNHRSSIGIEPNGELTIDPWCTVGIWKSLSLGNILVDSKSIEDLFLENQDKIISIKNCYDPNYRCCGCTESCSGGNRIVSAATYLNESSICNSNSDITAIYRALEGRDPACPLYEVK